MAVSESKSRNLPEDRYYLGTAIKSQIREASYSDPYKQKDAAQKRLQEKRAKLRGIAVNNYRPRALLGVIAAAFLVAMALLGAASYASLFSRHYRLPLPV